MIRLCFQPFSFICRPRWCCPLVLRDAYIRAISCGRSPFPLRWISSVWNSPIWCTACSPFDCYAHLSASAMRFHFGMYWFSGKLLACGGKNAFLLPKSTAADNTFSSEHQQIFRPDSATSLLVQTHYLTAWCRMVFSFHPITAVIVSVGSLGNNQSHWTANKISLYLNWIIKPKLAHADFMEAALLYIFLGAAIWSESKLALIDLIDCINVPPLPRGSINFPQRERSDWLARIISLAH